LTVDRLRVPTWDLTTVHFELEGREGHPLRTGGGLKVIHFELEGAFATGMLHIVLGLAAVLLATLNLVGGFVVTDRMLEMFGRGRKPPPPRTADETAEPRA
jgi:4TM region of pyridine nucleotide transhydrogenase, mitoch